MRVQIPQGIFYKMESFNNHLSYNKILFFKNAYELKLRLYYIIFSLVLTIIFCYIYSDAIIYFLVNPILVKMSSQRFIFTSLKEIFFLYLNFSLLMGFLLTLPVIFTQFIFFFINGLYSYELKLILKFFLLSILFFLLGGFIGYKIIIPNAWNFFLEFENNNNLFPLHFEAKLNNYIFFILNVLLGIIVCFQIPVIIFLLLSLKFLKQNIFFKNRKLVTVMCIILGTFISSPDIFSQLFLILIFLLMYEISIFLIYFFKKLN